MEVVAVVEEAVDAVCGRFCQIIYFYIAFRQTLNCAHRLDVQRTSSKQIDFRDSF